MKKINILFIFSLFFIFSCTEEEILPTDEDVIGDWKVTGLEYSGTSSYTILGQTTSVPFDGTGKNLDMTFLFNQDPQEFSSAGTYDIELVTDFQGQTYTQLYEGLGFLVPSGDWALNGKEITLTAAGFEPQVANIISFDAETLVFQATEISESSDFGLDIVNEIKLIFTLQRQ